MTTYKRLVPIIVASPLLLQNLDTSILATALPTVSDSLQVPPLHLNLAITSYLLSLVVFLPISGWLADRLGAKRVFCLAIAFFSLGSALCGAANSLSELVVFRILQGLGGAMMAPIGRLILLQSVPPGQMVAAMVWFTVPPVIGRMAGPLLGGAIVTVTSWRWIFFINIPFGIVAILLAMFFLEEGPKATVPAPFDGKGFVLLALGLCTLQTALETFGKALVPVWLSLLVAGVGLLLLRLYFLHGRDREHPIIDLSVLQFRTFKANVIGGSPLRVAIGASPFLLPLMFQLGFGLSPLESGMLTVATSIGALGTRVVMQRAIRHFGFRRLLLIANVLSSLCYLAYSRFTPETPHALMFGVMLFGGLVNSMSLVTLGTLGFSEVPKKRMSHATAISSMGQQLSISFGVVLGAALVSAVSWWHGGNASHLQATDFSPAFVVVGLLTTLSLFSFSKLRSDDGAELL